MLGFGLSHNEIGQYWIEMKQNNFPELLSLSFPETYQTNDTNKNKKKRLNTFALFFAICFIGLHHDISQLPIFWGIIRVLHVLTRLRRTALRPDLPSTQERLELSTCHCWVNVFSKAVVCWPQIWNQRLPHPLKNALDVIHLQGWLQAFVCILLEFRWHISVNW